MENNIKEIGGYFSLELCQQVEHYHGQAIYLNSSRNAFEYILYTKKPSKVYIPYFNCGVMMEPLNKQNIKYKYYKINKNLEIEENIDLNENELILYVNYFGIKNEYVDKLINEFKDQLIIDNSQSFFSKNNKENYAIYSPRKFFGVPDGGYLIGCDDVLPLKRDSSINRMKHLIGRLESNASKFYCDYKKNDDSLMNQPILKMSKVTETILGTLNYFKIKEIRNENFKYLHNNLKEFNNLKIDLKSIDGAMVYPFLLKKDIKDILISNKIYIATYWNDVLEIDNVPNNEVFLVKYIVPIPIDQRYTVNDMKKIIRIIKETIINV